MDLTLGDPPSTRQRGYKGSYGDSVNRITLSIQTPLGLYYLISPGWRTCHRDEEPLRTVDQTSWVSTANYAIYYTYVRGNAIEWRLIVSYDYANTLWIPSFFLLLSENDGIGAITWRLAVECQGIKCGFEFASSCAIAFETYYSFLFQMGCSHLAVWLKRKFLRIFVN